MQLDKICVQANEWLKESAQWSHKNKLKLNVSKTKLVNKGRNKPDNS